MCTLERLKLRFANQHDHLGTHIIHLKTRRILIAKKTNPSNTKPTKIPLNLFPGIHRQGEGEEGGGGGGDDGSLAEVDALPLLFV